LRHYTSYPINRLSLLLEKNEHYSECLAEITSYEKINDPLGLSKSEKESLIKRKARIVKILLKSEGYRENK
jgi:hypothetical protein